MVCVLHTCMLELGINAQESDHWDCSNLAHCKIVSTMPLNTETTSKRIQIFE